MKTQDSRYHRGTEGEHVTPDHLMQVKSNGSTFNCRIDGERGSWVLLSHGLATDMSMWDELTDALKDRYRVLRYDARGHGGSAATEGDYMLDQLVADAVGILDAFDVEQTHFAGLSMGGMIALGLMLDYPQRIKSAVIADSRHTTTPQFTEAWLTRAEAARKGGIDAVVDSTISRWSSTGLAERNPAAVKRMEKMIRNTSALGYRGCAAALARLNYGHRLSEILTPTLVICGTEDHGAPPENTRQMHAMIKGSRFLEIEQAGHISNIEKPEKFNAAVARLFDDVERDAASHAAE
ncbi:MAG TPA: alpha/beta fold hydrolase [Stellaceae bacterium]|nr:alpha/beta fold hydrolase [Stellaceae bacterium]